MQCTETKGIEGKLDYGNPGSAGFPGVKRSRGYCSAINLCFLMFSCLISCPGSSGEFQVSLPHLLGPQLSLYFPLRQLQ
jgi:hypothetical protein